MLGAIIWSHWSNRDCLYPGLKLPCWGLLCNRQVGTYIQYCPEYPLFLSLPLLPLLPRFSLLLCLSLSHREREHGCFDVGFDRFVCCCIHLLCIRELTGRKMKICLRFSAWLFGGKCERTSHAFQIHIFLYLKVRVCMPCIAINNKDCKVLTDWNRFGSYLLKANFFLTYPQNSIYCPKGCDTVM